MALSQSALSELLEAFRAGDGVDLIREAVRTVMQELIEFEAAERIGADRYERTESRTHERNGSRPRLVATKAGDVQLRIPKLRKGSFFPTILEPRRRIDQARYAVVMEAYVHGVSTRGIDDLVAALGIDSPDQQVGGLQDLRRPGRGGGCVPHPGAGPRGVPPRLPGCDLSARAQHQLDGDLDGGRRGHGVSATGEREILGLDVGDSEDEVSWKGFMTSLKQRGLAGVRLVLSDQHAGLVAALKGVSDVCVRGRS